MLHNLPAKVGIGQLGGGGLHLGDAHLGGNGLYLGIQLLGQHTAVHADELGHGGTVAGHVHLHHAKVLLSGEDLQGFGGVVRSNDNLQEDGLHAGSYLGGEGAVYTHNTTVDAHLVGLIGGLPGFFDGLAHGSAARVHMLEGHAEGLFKVTQYIEGGVGVLDVVVREFLALNLGGEGQGERDGFQRSVELGALVRVLAVAEALLKVVLQEELLVETGLGTHVSSDAGIVFGRMGIGLGR